MNTTIEYNEIRALIEKDRLGEAIEKLKANIVDKYLLNDLTMQSAKYNELKQLIRNDTIKFEEANISKAKIRHSLLQLLGEIENNKTETALITPKSKKNIWVISIALAVALLLYISGGFKNKTDTLSPKFFTDLQNLTIDKSQNFDLIKPNDGNYLWYPFKNDRGWQASSNNGNYILQNFTEPLGVNYIYVNTPQDENIISLEVKLETLNKNIPLPSCGLLLDFDRTTNYYYAFTINIDGEYNIFRKNENGLNKVFSNKLRNIDLKKFVKVAAIVNKETLSLYVNDELVKQQQIEKKSNSEVGLIAIGKGKFYFDNLILYKKQT